MRPPLQLLVSRNHKNTTYTPLLNWVISRKSKIRSLSLAGWRSRIANAAWDGVLIHSPDCLCSHDEIVLENSRLWLSSSAKKLLWIPVHVATRLKHKYIDSENHCLYSVLRSVYLVRLFFKSLLCWGNSQHPSSIPSQPNYNSQAQRAEPCLETDRL